jgi:hypothetical protein
VLRHVEEVAKDIGTELVNDRETHAFMN